MQNLRVVGRAALLAVVAMIAAPAVAQGLPYFPRWFLNGAKQGGSRNHEPFIMYGLAAGPNLLGGITQENKALGKMGCNPVAAGNIYNETTEGTEKGLAKITQFSTGGCKSEAPCKVANTRGEEEEGIYLTAQAPPVVEGSEAHTGASSLPWTGELIEGEAEVVNPEEKRHLLIHHVKYWVVFPPATVGTGPGCLGTEISFEDQEGATEKAQGDELAPVWINGSKNGIHPSHVELYGELGKTEKGFPITGRLISPVSGPGYLIAPRLSLNGAKGANELITAE